MEEKNPILVIEKREDKIKNWLKNSNNLVFLGILLLAIIIRLYYFNLTKTQPLWWDESDYLAYAKNLAGFSVNWTITSQHNSIYPFFVAAFFKLGLSEIFSKFVLQLLTSILSIFLVYLIIIEMYEDKRIALIASFLMATFWVHLFDTMRFHVDVSGLFTGLLAIYVFWRGYENKQKIFWRIDQKWAVPLTVFLVVLAYTLRRGHFLFGIFIFIYIISTRKWSSLFKDKYNWLSLILAVILIFISEKFIFISNIGSVSQTYYHPENKINFLAFDVFSSYFSSTNGLPSVLFLLFWIGFIVIISSVILSFGYIKKTEKSTARADLFNLINILITLAFFIYIIRTPDVFGEARWYYPLVLGAFVAIARSSVLIADLIRPYSRHAAILLLIIGIAIGGYYELNQADSIIKNKIDSFEGIRQAGLYLKDKSAKDDIIVSVAVPQVAYYAERDVRQPDKISGWNGAGEELPFEDFLAALNKLPEAKYFLISFSQVGHPAWMTTINGINGQVTAWEIPFMETKIDFATNMQDIKKSKSYGNITFNLLEVKQEVFIYEIKRT